ncbi:AH receptor-interacting protein-like [Acanthaster planci]|uniref:AH receptor-interacting protein-like n=1 Tax=Acanthaster planci TaxID=133434 RepID=A0A8B7YLI9_ACAPL|nr:AH receptor-interacting protein-like [Acanthaster planci]
MERALGVELGSDINKQLIHPGKGELSDYRDGTKIYFYYKVTKCNDERTVLDDNRLQKKPFELITGKQFKLDVWEKCLKTMRDGEVAEFTVAPSELTTFAPVMKKLRDIAKGTVATPEGGHCCGMAQMNQSGLGYPDLDEFLKQPEPLRFTFEVVRIEEEGQYRKESWAMSHAEKRAALPLLREEGNRLYNAKQYAAAAQKYAEALGCLENLLLHEQPNSPEWLATDDMRIPFLLNFAQCKLMLQDYYQVIEHTTTVLTKEETNVKALYRRAKAYAACWDFSQSRKDFKMALELDPSLGAAIRKEFRLLEEAEKKKDEEDKVKMKAVFERFSE